MGLLLTGVNQTDRLGEQQKPCQQDITHLRAVILSFPLPEHPELK